MEGYIAQIIMFAGNFAPRGWAFCQGQLLSIAQNTAVFSLLGTTFGGDGQTTFGLPDFRSRVPVGTGQGPGLSSYVLGQLAGVENVTLTQSQMPAHTHQMAVANTDANSATPQGRFLGRAIDGNNQPIRVYEPTPNTILDPAAISTVGGSQPFSIIQPYLGMNFVICLEGIFPSRN